MLVLLTVVILRNVIQNAADPINMNVPPQKPHLTANIKMLNNGPVLVVLNAHLDITAQAGNVRKIMLLRVLW